MPNYRELKNRIRFSTTLEPETLQKLKDFSDKTEVPISKIVNKAILMYLESVQK